MTTTELRELLKDDAEKKADSYRKSAFNQHAGTAYFNGHTSTHEIIVSLVESLNSIAALHLDKKGLKACGVDEVLNDTKIAREALSKLHEALKGVSK
jgi:hypothetical protein